MTTLLIAIALILALVDQFRAQGQDLTDWAVVAVCTGLLWSQMG